MKVDWTKDEKFRILASIWFMQGRTSEGKLAEVSDIGFSNIEEVIARPSDATATIPERQRCTARIRNADTEQEAVTAEPKEGSILCWATYKLARKELSQNIPWSSSFFFSFLFHYYVIYECNE